MFYSFCVYVHHSADREICNDWKMFKRSMSTKSGLWNDPPKVKTNWFEQSQRQEWDQSRWWKNQADQDQRLIYPPEIIYKKALGGTALSANMLCLCFEINSSLGAQSERNIVNLAGLRMFSVAGLLQMFGSFIINTLGSFFFFKGNVIFLQLLFPCSPLQLSWVF